MGYKADTSSQHHLTEALESVMIGRWLTVWKIRK